MINLRPGAEEPTDRMGNHIRVRVRANPNPNPNPN